MDVAAWLRDLGLERYAPAFRDAEVTPGALPELTDADLRELGLPLGPCKVVLKAIRDLAGPSATEAAAEAARAVAWLDIPPAPSEAERRQLTVLFWDRVGSTGLAAPRPGGPARGHRRLPPGLRRGDRALRGPRHQVPERRRAGVLPLLRGARGRRRARRPGRAGAGRSWPGT